MNSDLNSASVKSAAQVSIARTAREFEMYRPFVEAAAVYRRRFTSYTTGFDPALAYYHPGTFLLMRMSETFCSWRLEAIDFGSGESDYKRKVGTRNVEEASPLLFAPTMQGMKLALSTNGLALVTNVARRVLNENNRARLKSLWRQLLQKRQAQPAEPAEPGSH